MTQARPAASTVTFVDEYCQLYEDVFPDVRSFEHFKRVQAGMLSEIKRKTLPAIAKATGKSDPQALHHFVAYAPWKTEERLRSALTRLGIAKKGKRRITWHPNTLATLGRSPTAWFRSMRMECWI